MFKNRNNQIFITIQNIFLYFLVIFFSAFTSIPIKVLSVVSCFPNIPSILIFYFFIINKDEIPYFSIFIFGIFFDIFNGFPLASTSLIWLITSKFISFLRRQFYKPDKFIFLFRDFTIFAFLNSLLQWILFSIIHKFSYPLLNSLCQFIFDIACFGLVYLFIKNIEKKFY
ncbi:MAG TPA: hypothetical protein VLL98_02745 [Rickettsiales bacterium]|nr:hypothetical protein [Rickettsiales bacterium]